MEDCLKKGLGQLEYFDRGLSNKEGVVLLGGDTPMHTMDIKNMNLNINQTNNQTEQVKCILNFLIMGSVFEILSESTPVNTKLIKQLEEVCI